MPENPLEADDARDMRIRERAYHLWQSEGEPHGNENEYLERARELVAIEESAGAGQLPVPKEGSTSTGGVIVEEAFIQDNLGEFPDRLSDQGEHQATPRARK